MNYTIDNAVAGDPLTYNNNYYSIYFGPEEDEYVPLYEVKTEERFWMYID